MIYPAASVHASSLSCALLQAFFFYSAVRSSRALFVPIYIHLTLFQARDTAHHNITEISPQHYANYCLQEITYFYTSDTDINKNRIHVTCFFIPEK